MSTITLRPFQREAVNKVVNSVRASFTDHSATARKAIVLDSPTGSGKTVMLGHIIDESLQDALTIILGPGSGNLEDQTCRRLQSVCQVVTVKKLDTTTLSTPAHSGLAVVSNWESLITRSRRTNEYKVALTKEQENTNLFDWVAEASSRGIPVVIIVDEAHHGATKAASGIQDFLADLGAVLKDPKTGKVGSSHPLFIEASATPLSKDWKDIDNLQTIKVNHEVVIASGLMRKNGSLNAGILDTLSRMPEDERGGIGAETVLLQGAYDQMKMVDAEYKRVGSKQHSLIVVQIPNMKQGAEAQERTIRFFRQYGITEESGQLAIFTSAKKSEDIDDIANSDSPIKVLIYKQAIATGWDCPRAQILVGFRHLTSHVFTLQNLGRICRTTEAKHYGNDILDNFYIYSNVSDLGLGLFKEDIVEGLPAYVSWGEADSDDIALFNSLHLPQSHFKRTNRSPVEMSILRSALKKALSTSEGGSSFLDSFRIMDNSEVQDTLYEITRSTEDIYNDTLDGGVKAQATKKVGKSSAATARALLNKIEGVIKENGRDFGANNRLAEGISRIVLAWMVMAATAERGALYDKVASVVNRDDPKSAAFDWNDWAAGQLLGSNFPAFRKVINRALATPGISSFATSNAAGPEDGAARETRELLFLGSYELPRTSTTDRVDEKKVPSGLAPYYLYTAEQVGDGGNVEAWRQEAVSGPEKAFEEVFLANNKERLKWFYKNPPRNFSDFSIGVTTEKSAINFFPDYIVAFKKGDDIMHAILEVKGENISGLDENAEAKAKAALTYSKNTGIPVAVVHPTNAGEWRVAGTDSVLTLEDFLFSQDWEAKKLPYVARTGSKEGAELPAELNWVKEL